MSHLPGSDSNAALHITCVVKSTVLGQVRLLVFVCFGYFPLATERFTVTPGKIDWLPAQLTTIM